MSIYIKGMAMPEKSGVVTLRIWGNGRIEKLESYHSWLLAGVTATMIPEHGRLIDADLIMEKLKESCRIAFGGDGDIPEYSGLSIVADYIESAPTIIPASEVGE